ncbi:recombinase family protein [Bradyrhizobium sp. WSM 4400]|nr:recombinase family protein [Bradyrhizobium australafricanum]
MSLAPSSQDASVAQGLQTAAQYVRMSTEHQRYSLENQAAMIATFAAARHIKIVRTYLDRGRSGLRISNRPALLALIDDILTRRADFNLVLVYDVTLEQSPSRGRLTKH